MFGSVRAPPLRGHDVIVIVIMFAVDVCVALD